MKLFLLEGITGFTVAGKLGSFAGLCRGLSWAQASDQSYQSVTLTDLSEL